MVRLCLSLALFLSPAVAQAQVALEAPLRFLDIAPNNPNTLYAIPTLGLLRSSDAGLTWTQVPILSPNAQPPALNSLAFSPQSASTFFVCGGFTGNALLWRTVDAGLNFAALSSGLPAAPGRACEHLDAFGSALYAQLSGGPNGNWEIFKSTNNGDSWSLVGAAPRRVYISPSSPNVMFYPSGVAILRSTNEGQSFTGFSQVRASDGLNGVNTIAIHPTNPGLLLATMTGPSGNQNGIFRSTNGGAMWERVFNGNTIGVRFNPYNPAEAWAGDCCGNLSVLRSSNGGTTWTTLSIRIDSTPISPSAGPVILTLPNNPSIVLTGTTRGFYRSDDGGVAFARRGTYSPWAASSTPILATQLLTREAVTARPTLQIRGAEDPRYTFSEIAPAPASVPWVTAASTSGSSFIPVISARDLDPGQYSGALRIAVPGAPNSPLEVPLQLTVTSNIRNSYFYAGPLDGPASLTSLALTPSGNLLYASSSRIFELPAQGPPRLIAGGGSGGDGSPADQAAVSLVASPVYSPQGELFFAEDRLSGRIRRISRDGIITTVAGGGATTPASGLNPTSVTLPSPKHIAFDPAGNLVIATSNRLWRIVNNSLQLLAGGGSSTSSGTAATSFAFSNPRGLAVAPDGRIFFTLSGRHAIFVLQDNRVVHFAGSDSLSGHSGDGSSISLARFRNPTALALSPAGDLFLADNTNLLIRRIRPDRTIEAVMGSEDPGDPALCAVAESAPLRLVSSLLVRGSTLLFADGLRAQQIHLLPNATPDTAPSQLAALHGASFTPQLSPGSIFSIFGDRVAPGEAFARSTPLSTLLGSSSVCFDGHPVPLFYTSTNQLNGQVPYAVRTGETAWLRVFTPAGVSPPLAVTVSPTAPGVFQYGESHAIAVNPDGRLNSPGSPSAPGTAVVVYLSGTGTLDNPVPTGHPAPSNPLARPTAPVSATINDIDAPVLFLGLSPGFIGLAQANLTIPNLPPGTYNLIINIGGAASPPVRITVG